MNLSALTDRLPVEQFEQLRAEWASNQRLRLGLLAIWMLLLVWLLLVLSDLAAESGGDLRTTMQRLQRVEAIHAQQEWVERAASGEEILRSVQAGFPAVASSGRAEAQVRSMLEKLLREHGTRKLKLTMASAEALQDGELWSVSGTIRGVVPGDIVREVLAEAETLVDNGRITRLRLIHGKTPEKVRIEAELEYFFRAGGV